MTRVNYQAVKVEKKIPAFHAHGCLQCGQRYMDSCDMGSENGRCHSCRTGKASPLDSGRRPMACCRTESRLIDSPAILARYLLGGPGPWFLCQACHRTHPFDPKGTP